MFIKKDLRKIDVILQDPNDPRESLKLAKRAVEFQGSIRILCHSSNLESLKLLKELNLFDNALSSLQGIGNLSQSPLHTLNLGSNKLNSIPLELGTLSSLRSVWLDDNEFEDFPISLCQLRELKLIRLSGNDIKIIPSSISALNDLQLLALDNNCISEFPINVLKLRSLRDLWLRGNKIASIPNEISSLKDTLQILSLSSNMLTEIPENILALSNLRKLYLNGNSIMFVPEKLYELRQIEVINLANNKIQDLPLKWVMEWGKYDANAGVMTGKGENDEPQELHYQLKLPHVNLLGNPLNIKFVS